MCILQSICSDVNLAKIPGCKKDNIILMLHAKGFLHSASTKTASLTKNRH